MDSDISRSKHPVKKQRISSGPVGGFGEGLISPIYPSSIKKWFPPEKPDSEYSHRHYQYCDVCKKDRLSDSSKGDLIHCQGCSLSFHVVCGKNSHKNNVIRVTEHLLVFQCKYCAGADSDISRQCLICNKVGLNCAPIKKYEQSSTVNSRASTPHVEGALEAPVETITDPKLFNEGRLLFRCVECKRAAHFSCLSPSGDYLRKHADFRCDECTTNEGKIDVILAWRPLDVEQRKFDVKGGIDLSIDLTTISYNKREYLIKYQDMSYLNCRWVRGDWMHGIVNGSTIRSFEKKNSYPVYKTEDKLSEDYYRVDIIFDIIYKGNKKRDKMRFKSLKEELLAIDDVELADIKWKAGSYTDCCWEEPPPKSEQGRYDDFRFAYEDHVRGYYIHIPKGLDAKISAVRRTNFNKLEYSSQPSSMKGGDLMSYQLEGMNWLYYKWYKNKPAILADDMGLGKTVQTISYLTILFERHGVWPFLIVAPQSTVPNWKREFQKWAPGLRVVATYGGRYQRDIQQNFEICKYGDRSDINCHVVIASYNVFLDDTFLKQFQWQAMILDEGQKLKSDKTMTNAKLSGIETLHKVILTGTPLQNNIRELFNLLQFLNPDDIDADELEERFSDMTEENVRELHELLRPYILRRTKEEVLNDVLPSKVEIAVPLTMTRLQRTIYKTILQKDPELLRSIVSRTNTAKPSKIGVNNMLMQLRKCVCHPYLYSSDLEEKSDDGNLVLERLIGASSKLQLLSLLIPTLIKNNHRILIFSQFLTMLDILEDFLFLLNIQSTRLDGTLSTEIRQKRIDSFNDPNSEKQVFILSTRAGGVGINLATADTVIMYDQDYNPHQDMQAFSRAHRLGQKNVVLIFNLVTKDTVEENMWEIGQHKKILDQVVIEDINKERDRIDLSAMVRNGVRSLFEDESAVKDIKYDQATVDKLVDRSQVEEDQMKASSQSRPTEASSFGFVRVWENDSSNLEDVSDNVTENESFKIDAENGESESNFWDNFLNQREAEIEAERIAKQDLFGRGRRVRESFTKVCSTLLFRRQPKKKSVYHTDFVKPQQGMATKDAIAEVFPDEDEWQEKVSHKALKDESPTGLGNQKPVDGTLQPGVNTKTPTQPTISSLPNAVNSVSVAPGAIQGTSLLQTPVTIDAKLHQSSVSNQTIAATLIPNFAVFFPPKAGPVQLPSSELPVTVDSRLSSVPSVISAPIPCLGQFMRPGQIQTNRPSLLESAQTNTSFASVTPVTTTTSSHESESSLLKERNQIEVHLCDGSHSNHAPGKCPMREAIVEPCPLCSRCHFSGAAVCPYFGSMKQLNFMIEATRKSEEPQVIKDEALRYLEVLKSVFGR
ncbi:P-loop containing nucleoside triphosphate hydrolase protein [Lipomyces japonicus]|uniref:P-loop containing nucleoside triphosphate hydrolase protein n=1 Tax=Lipomyces japonicus TaxID=56871 RepID=UPI0034CD43B0